MSETTARRKNDHVAVVEKMAVASAAGAGWDCYRFTHNALPEIDLHDVDLSTVVFGKRLAAPIIISSMTGGTSATADLNRRLASVAQGLGLGMGVGSQRMALEDQEAVRHFQVRDVAPGILLFANIGAVQLNYGVTPRDCAFLVESIGADALFLHLNSIQEALQVEGNTNFRGLGMKIAGVCRAVPVPVIVKEVGWGISAEVAKILCDAGVSGIDVAGAGGTSWSEVEKNRTSSPLLKMVAEGFAGWGIPTTEALIAVRAACPGACVIASGGLKSGVDIAKALALGADLCGLAAPVIRAALVREKEATTLLTVLVEQLRLAMFGIGAPSLPDLRGTKHLVRIEPGGDPRQL